MLFPKAIWESKAIGSTGDFIFIQSLHRMLAYMETDGIPDTINKMSASDGKTMLVEYLTYKDFESVYNPDMSGKDEVEARYALVDLETGAVYKDNSLWE